MSFITRVERSWVKEWNFSMNIERKTNKGGFPVITWQQAIPETFFKKQLAAHAARHLPPPPNPFSWFKRKKQAETAQPFERVAKILQWSNQEFFIMQGEAELYDYAGDLIFRYEVPFFDHDNLYSMRELAFEKLRAFIFEDLPNPTFVSRYGNSVNILRGDTVLADIGNGDSLEIARSWPGGAEMKRLRAELHRAFITEKHVLRSTRPPPSPVALLPANSRTGATIGNAGLTGTTTPWTGTDYLTAPAKPPQNDDVI